MSNERIENIIERSVINDKFSILGEHEGHFHMMIHNSKTGKLLKEKNAHILNPNLMVGVLSVAGLATSCYFASQFIGPASWVAFALGYCPTMSMLYHTVSSNPKPNYNLKNFELYKEFMLDKLIQ